MQWVCWHLDVILCPDTTLTSTRLAGHPVHLRQELGLEPPRRLVFPVGPPGRYEGIHLVKEHDAGGPRTGHLKQRPADVCEHRKPVRCACASQPCRPVVGRTVSHGCVAGT